MNLRVEVRHPLLLVSSLLSCLNFPNAEDPEDADWELSHRYSTSR